MKNLTVLSMALALVSATDVLAQRISFADFSGPGASAVRNQLVSAICDTADCVAPSKTTTRGRPDWKKVKKAQVQFLITGAVATKAKSVELQVYDMQGARKARKSLPLEKHGTLSAKNLQGALDLLKSAFGAAEESPPAPPAPPPTKPRPSEPSLPSEPPPPIQPPSREPSPPMKAEAPKVEPQPEPAPVKPPKQGKKGPKFLALEVGVSLLSRKLDYVQAATPNLRRYELPFPFPQIDARVEFYPLALVRHDALAPLGVDFSIGLAPYLKSRRQSSPESYPTSTMRITGGVRYRWAPFETYAAAFTPLLGVDVRNFTVGPTTDGTSLDGLPDVSFVGLRAGLALELPILPDFLVLFGRFCAMPMFSSGPLIGPAYFPRGSTFGLDVNGGLAVQLASFFQVRMAFEFEQYSSTFDTQPTDTYVAAGSVDRYLGASAAARFEF
jgi:hypothetical protein